MGYALQKSFISGTVGNQNLYKEALHAPMLEKSVELDLATRWREQKDEKALSELTRSYLRLVISMSKKFRHYGLAQSELIQEGTVGLLLAAERFEPKRDLRFSTYASWWIRATLQDFVLRNWSIVRTGTTAAHKKLFFSLRRVRTQLLNNTDGPISSQGRGHIAKEMGVKVKDVEAMEGRLQGMDYSLNAPVGDEGHSQWQDHLEDERLNPEETVMDETVTAVRSTLLTNALDVLTDGERMIITKRCLNDEVMTLADLGDIIGVSKERIRQLEVQALDKLKVEISKQLKSKSATVHDIL